MTRRSRRAAIAITAATVLFGIVTAAAWAQGPWVAPPEAKNTKNPVKGQGVPDGKKVAEQNCVPCHGPGGKGDGPAAAALPTKPADWTSDRVQKETDGELFWKISNGRGPMPPWKHLPDQDRWKLVNYIRTLKKK